MIYNRLGQTDFMVSKLCFGALTMSPLQKNATPEQSMPVLARAIEQGVNFFDTADLYNAYHIIKQALSIKKDLILCTKSYDYEAQGVTKSVERALRETGRDYIDIYMLHEQESRHTFEGHWEAIATLIKMKEQGKIRAFGISTHCVQAVLDAVDYPEIEVLFPLINLTGIGIEDGTAQDMEKAIEKAHRAGKGIFAMKILGGGNLLNRVEACFDYALNLPTLDAIALGMQSIEEVDYNVAKIKGQAIPDSLKNAVARKKRVLHIDDWCEGCGQCIKKCSQEALKIVDGHPAVNRARCVTCGYCAAVCPLFCIKVI
ncbi:MAG: aldo/keto reductase [Eubacteriaceae bacterium]|nr:aldo/keto reductase [Eubacteriaceae bacterium]